jgi:hypothetical protein
MREKKSSEKLILLISSDNPMEGHWQRYFLYRSQRDRWSMVSPFIGISFHQVEIFYHN